MSKFKGKAKGIMDGLENNEEEKNKKAKEDKSKRVKEEKSDQTQKINKSEDEKLKRSYMLKKDTIRKLKLIEIEQIDKTLSEIVEEAIIRHYKHLT